MCLVGGKGRFLLASVSFFLHKYMAFIPICIFPSPFSSLAAGAFAYNSVYRVLGESLVPIFVHNCLHDTILITYPWTCVIYDLYPRNILVGRNWEILVVVD